MGPEMLIEVGPVVQMDKQNTNTQLLILNDYFPIFFRISTCMFTSCRCCAVCWPYKVSPYIIHNADYIFLLDNLISARIF